jgi:hypothetical protein
MNFKQHAQLYFSVLVILILCTYQSPNSSWQLFLAMTIGFFMINPDIDQLFPQTHRSFLTHSTILPLTLYWAWHPYLNLNLAQEFAWVLFFPIIIHLIGDLKIKELFDLDLSKQKQQEHREQFMGTWRIWYGGKRMSYRNSILWIVGNIGIMVGLLTYWTWI